MTSHQHHSAYAHADSAQADLGSHRASITAHSRPDVRTRFQQKLMKELFARPRSDAHARNRTAMSISEDLQQDLSHRVQHVWSDFAATHPEVAQLPSSVQQEYLRNAEVFVMDQIDKDKAAMQTDHAPSA